MTQHTPGPWRFRIYYQDDAEIPQIRSLGLEPTKALTNEGQRIVMSSDGRVALVDCQSEFKRGQGYKADCAERDANARLIAAAPELLEPWLAADDKDWDHLLRMIPDSGHGQFWKAILLGHRAAIARATSQGSPDTIEPSNAEGMVP